MTTQAGEDTSFLYKGRAVHFHIDEPTDVIQMTQKRGEFYETPTLERLRNVIPEGATIIDAGANVGNHSVYFGLFCKPKRIIPFEPNKHMASILRKNVGMNALTSVDLSCVQFALGRSRSRAQLVVRRANNWGNGHLIAKDDDPGITVFNELVEVRPIDEFAVTDLDFMKVDVEGHEVEVLQGALETIKQCRPALFIEIGQVRLKSIADILIPIGYQVIDLFCQHRTQLNLLYVPIR